MTDRKPESETKRWRNGRGRKRNIEQRGRATSRKEEEHSICTYRKMLTENETMALESAVRNKYPAPVRFKDDCHKTKRRMPFVRKIRHNEDHPEKKAIDFSSIGMPMYEKGEQKRPKESSSER